MTSMQKGSSVVIGRPELNPKHKRVILSELKERNLWFVALRWWVPPSILVCAFAAWLLGVVFSILPIIAMAFSIFFYNAALFIINRYIKGDIEKNEKVVRRFTYWQVGLDYAAMFVLINFTGGVDSPLIYFFIFHIIFASILLPSISAYGFAALAAAGMFIIALAERLELIQHHVIYFHNRTIGLEKSFFFIIVELLFFSTSVFITAFCTTSIMRMLKKRIVKLAELSDAVTMLNNRFSSLFAMTQAIVSIHNLEKVLDIIAIELTTVMKVKGISVKLLSGDHTRLHYAAVNGLPLEFLKDKTVEINKSPLNKRIIEGESFVIGRITGQEKFQLEKEFVEAQIKSILLVPLIAENRIIGVLGSYCSRTERFDKEEIEFFKLASDLVAVAIENASGYEKIEDLIKSKSWFLMRVAHNLRAPLSALISMLEVVKDEHLGALNDEQKEHLRRVDRRARTMIDIISELLTLAKSRTEKNLAEFKPIEMNWLIGRLHRTFIDAALEKGLKLEFSMSRKLPEIWGEPGMIEQAFENLLSNAIKYSSSKGKVIVDFSAGSDNTIKITVMDDGIGIPECQMDQLFTEFFRADNAKDKEEMGTGLGLSIVKETIDLHKGRIHVESKENHGTIFTIHLPVFIKDANCGK